MQFQLFNIPITIRLSFWPFLLFCSLDANPIYMALLAVIFAGSLLIHELGHGLAALKWGASPAITLEAFGGYTSFSRSIDEKKHFLITLAGPLFTAFLIALAYYLLKSRLFESYWPNVFCYMLMRLNIYWLLINLAPLRPLDGGKMAAYFFQKIWRKIWRAAQFLAWPSDRFGWRCLFSSAGQLCFFSSFCILWTQKFSRRPVPIASSRLV